MTAKRFYKKSSLEEYRISAELNGHIISFGRIGAGKSVSLLSICQGFKDNFGYKIFDIYGGERNEGLFWTLPNQDKAYWDKIRLNVGDFDEEPAKQYKVNLLYPYFESKLPIKLPIKKINGEIIVNSKIFTIPLNDIEIDDIKMIIGTVAETNKYIWDEIQNTIKKTDTCEILDVITQELGGTNTTIYRNFVKPMSREKLLMNHNCDTNIDILDEMKNKDVVSVLCLDFVPEKFHLFIMNYILKKMMQYLDEGKVHKKNIVYMRELGTFFRATDEAIVEDRFKIFKSQLAHYMRMGRRGCYFAGDTQSAAEVRSVCQGSEDFLIMHLTTSWRDKEEMTQELIREKRMRRDQVSDLSFLQQGECYIAEMSKVVHKVRILLPRTMYWKKEYPNFYKVMWESYGGDWHDVTDKIDYINDLCDKQSEELAEKKAKLKEKAERKEATKDRKEDARNTRGLTIPKKIVDENLPKIIPVKLTDVEKEDNNYSDDLIIDF
jgi:hypothetical protein